MIQDHELVGRLIDREHELHYPSKAAFGRALKIDRSSVYRFIEGDARIKSATLRRAEVLLGLPRGFLDAVRQHDTTAIADSGAKPDVVAWVLDQIRDAPKARNRRAQ